MKQNLFNKLWLRVGMIVAIMTTALSGTAWAETWTHTFASPEAISNNSITVGGATWNVTTTAGAGAPTMSTGTYSKTYGLKFGSSKSVYYGSVTFSTDYFNSYNVQSVTVNILNNGSKQGTLTAQQGNTSIGSKSSTFGTTWTDLTVDTNSGLGGSLSFTYSVEQAFYIHSISVTYTTGGGTPTPSISASDVNIAYNATNGSIAYTLSNATGNVTASVTEGDWLTLGTITSSAVSFTCSENPGKTARTATVKLSYTDASDKVVTVTQAGNPNIVDNISDITAVNTSYKVKGTVVATNSRGFVIGDGTGYVYTYLNSAPSQNVGDKVTISGTTGSYGHILQFTSSATITEANTSNYDNTPAITVVDASAISAYAEDYQLSDYVQFEGTLTSSVSGNYTNYNISVGNATARISYPTDAQATALNNLINNVVRVKGYFAGFSSSTFTVMMESVEEVVTPVINANDVELAYNATSGEIAYTIANPTGATLTATTSADWISNIVVSSDKVTFTATANEGNADRTATITLSYTGAEDVTVTVTQGHYVADYATLPFSFDGGRADIANTAGLTETGLGTDYGSSPKLKFDTTDDDLILKINERPGVLTFDVKGNPGGNPSAWIGTFTIQASADGTSYSDVVSYNNLASTTESKTVNNLPADARYIKFVYEKTQGNVALGNIELAEYVYIPPVINANNTVALAFDATEGEIPYTIDYAVDGVSLTATENADWISGIAVTADKVTFNTTANEGEARTATITLSYTGATDKEVTVTQAAYVAPFASTTWTLASSITSGKHYIIVNNASEKAMGAQGNNNRAAVGVDIEDETATVSSADVQEFVIYGPDAAGFFTIYDGTGYLYAASSGSNHLKTKATVDDDARWAISFGEGGVASIVATKSSNHNVMQYNNGSTLFSCYSSASQSAVSLYEKAGEATSTESVTVGNLSYATFASDNALDFTSSSIKAFYAKESAGTLSFTQVTKVPAGTGVLLYADGGATESVPALTGAADAVTGNVFKRGAGVAVTYTDNDQNYILFNGADGIGFYKANNNTVATNRAYIHVTSSNPVKSFAIDLEDDATGISLMEDGKSQMEDGAIYNVAGQRISKMQKGINIVNGKKILK